MRYALISDLHANRQALNAVFADIHSVGVDAILCLGDVVGYGPCPAEVLAAAYARVHHFVQGNHDAVVAGTLAADSFNDDARRIIEWTAGQLDRKAARFLAQQPLVLQGDGFRLCHGEFTDPPAFQYLWEPADALASWASAPEPVLFVGHTHMPALFVVGHSGAAHALPAQDFVLEEGKRFIVNVGSVGQPRHGEVLASWVFFDAARGTVFFRKVPFDLDAYRADLQKAGISAKPSYFLSRAAAAALPALREEIDFRPAATPAGARNDYKVVHLEQALRSARRWRSAGLVLAALLLLLLAAAFLLLPRLQRGDTVYAATSAPTRLPAALVALPLLEAPEALGRIGPRNRPALWSVRLRDPRAQWVETLPQDPAETGTDAPLEPVFRLVSRRPLPLTLSAEGAAAEAGQRFTASAQFKTLALESGWVAVSLVQTLPDGSEKLLAQKELKRTAPHRWEAVKFTLDKRTGALAAPGRLRFEIRAQFRGELLVRRCNLERCE